ncbi:hypothetical protein DMENIID0001_137210 [Sergentomyia squamirostris]
MPMGGPLSPIIADLIMDHTISRRYCRMSSHSWKSIVVMTKLFNGFHDRIAIHGGGWKETEDIALPGHIHQQERQEPGVKMVQEAIGLGQNAEFLL